MEHSTAQRRLVKSPPELWAEVSSEDTLGRHLAPFGEIRITRAEPETTVAWEGDRASGTVQLEPAGWGTRVILTATPTQSDGAAAPEPPAVAPEPPPATVAAGPKPPAGAAGPPPATVAPGPKPAAGAAGPPPATVAPGPKPAAGAAGPKPAAGAAAPQPEPRQPSALQEPKRGFFARLFRRRLRSPARVSRSRAPSPAVPDLGPPAPDPEATLAEPDAPTPAPPAAAQPPAAATRKPDLGLDLDDAVAILTEVLDDLGADHHRPFSRD